MKKIIIFILSIIIFLPNLTYSNNNTLDGKEINELIQLANEGDADAQFNLALLYGYGRGVEPDYQKAMKLISLSAHKGHARAQSFLGMEYDKKNNYQEAIKWYTLAANQGDTDAQTNLGLIYLQGRGAPQNYEEAVKWSTLAANQGDALAQNNLGIIYQHGLGVKQDYNEAVKWYTLAINQGSSSAKFNLDSLDPNKAPESSPITILTRDIYNK